MEWWKWWIIILLAMALLWSMSGCIAASTPISVRPVIKDNWSILFVPRGTMIGNFKTTSTGLYLDGPAAMSVQKRLEVCEKILENYSRSLL